MSEESPRKSVKFKHYRNKSGTDISLQKRLQVIKSAVLARTEVLTILSPIREAEGPENVRKWLLRKHLKMAQIINKMLLRTALQP